MEPHADLPAERFGGRDLSKFQITDSKLTHLGFFLHYYLLPIASHYIDSVTALMI